MLNLLGQVLTYIVPFLLVLTLVVTVHELGHYWVARAFGDFSQRQIAFSKEFSGAFKERHGRNGR